MAKSSFLSICTILLAIVAIEAQVIGSHSGYIGTGDVNFENCKTQCQFNSGDSKPVCGTDGKTYPNVEILTCAARCGRDVRVNYEGCCRNDRF